MTTTTINIIDEAQMPTDVDAAIRRLLGECFPNDAAAFDTTRAWHGSSPFVTILAYDDKQQLTGHMALHERTIDVSGVTVRVAGLQNVCIAPGHRKTGLLAKLMKATMAQVAQRNYDGGMLFCLPVLQRVYARVGWYELPGRTVTRIDETGAETILPNQDVAMFHPLRLPTLPPGDIHLRGNDW